MEGESTGLEVTAATLVAGLAIGYLWQHSKACSVSGYRDFYLFRDTYLLKTVLGMFVGAAVGFAVLGLFSPYESGYLSLLNTPGLTTGTIVLIFVGGIGFGLFSVLAGGCPTKQHVAAASGSKTSMLYLLGFYAGLIYFQVVILEYLLSILGTA
ncbi:MAG TPA: YeeE/YedE thiosulfate transporter family protein [Conexivisphaerales archaeon]|nr:YeeE/YedE thiosulfate transporter family protein [Conexivisphaerales archaeon]